MSVKACGASVLTDKSCCTTDQFLRKLEAGRLCWVLVPAAALGHTSLKLEGYFGVFGMKTNKITHFTLNAKRNKEVKKGSNLS